MHGFACPIAMRSVVLLAGYLVQLLEWCAGRWLWVGGRSAVPCQMCICELHILPKKNGVSGLITLRTLLQQPVLSRGGCYAWPQTAGKRGD